LDDAVSQSRESRSKKPALVSKFKSEVEELRPRVEWVEQHLGELNTWQTFLILNANYGIDLMWGSDTATLWTFIQIESLARRDFSNLIGETIR